MYEGSKKMLVFLCCTFGVTVSSGIALTVLNVLPTGGKCFACTLLLL